ncbi:MAG: hypothetical protein J5964_01800 [Eubacterium sp.]|nr:hypothetical protein [Eubacterium sp.]
MDNDVILKLSKFAVISSYAGLITVGAVPAFGLIAISIGIVLQIKLGELEPRVKTNIKTSRIAGIISLLLFPADVALLYILIK